MRRILYPCSDAMATILELYKRAQAVCATDLNHYVFPACENDRIDPTRPQTTWRTAWRRLTRAVLCPGCGSSCRIPPTSVATRSAATDIHDLKSPLGGAAFPRPAPSRDHRARGVTGKRPDGHGDRRSRLAQDARPLFPRPARCHAPRPRRSEQSGFVGGLWHKPRHKRH